MRLFFLGRGGLGGGHLLKAIDQDPAVFDHQMLFDFALFPIQQMVIEHRRLSLGAAGRLFGLRRRTMPGFLTQVLGIVAIGAFVSAFSVIVWLALKFTLGVRASSEDQLAGLDRAECGLEAYPEFTKTGD